MNKVNINKNILIISIVIIAILGATIACIFSARVDEQTASADLVYTNGNVPDGYVSDYKNGTRITTKAGLLDWLHTTGSSSSPLYAYLDADITIDNATMTAYTTQYHFLDGCGHTVTIANPTNTSISSIITESATYSNQSAFVCNESGNTTIKSTSNYLDCGDGTGDEDGIIQTYCNGTSYDRQQGKTPFGPSCHSGTGGTNMSERGFYTAGYLASIYAYSTLNNTKFVYTGTFAFNKQLGRGLSAGILFGYLYNSTMDNCSVSVEGYVGINFQSRNITAAGYTCEGLGTVCFGGYAGVVDQYSTITNSKINIANGKFISVHTYCPNGRTYSRTFVGGVCGAIVNGAEIINTTATGSGHIRGWVGTDCYNRLGLAGIIAGANLSGTPAAAAYTPASMGSQEKGSSKASTGTIDGVICSWTGVAMFYVDTNKYIYGASESDAYFHGTALNGTHTTSCGEHFYGGLICAANSSSSINNIFYTFDKATLSDISYDTFRKVRQDEGQSIDTAKNCVGVQTVVIGTVPAANYFTLQMQQIDGTYATTTGTYTRPTYSGASSVIEPSTLTGGPYYTNGTVSGFGTVSNIQTDVFGLEWSNQSSSANVVASVDATKVTGYSADSGLFVWSLDAYLNGVTNSASKACYAYANSMEDALTNYRQYKFNDSIMSRSSSGASYVIKASVGYAGTYIMTNDDFTEKDSYTESKGSKTYNKETRMTIPTVKLYTLNTSASNSMVRMKVLGSHTGINVSDTITTYKSEGIWAVFKQGEAYVYGFDDIQDAGTYTLRVYNGISNATNANFKYDILDETNKIVAYKVDNKYYDANYRTSLWQPTYTYTINQKEVYGAWHSMSNAVDGGTLAEPTDFTYTGSAFNFSYNYSSGLMSGDTNTIPMSYEAISYARLSAANLERNNEYYTIDDNGNYVLVGTYTREDENKYFIDPVNPAIHHDVDKSVYYKRVYTPAEAIKNAGSYRVTIGECTNSNYKLIDSLARQYYVTVSPRTIQVLYRGMDNLVYNSDPQQVTWVVANHAGELIVSSGTGVTVGNANIVASYVFEPAALDFKYDQNNGEFTIAGEYYVSISLASGAVSKNYLLPTSIESITSAEGETVFVHEYNEATAITEFASGVTYYTRSGSDPDYVYTKVAPATEFDNLETYYTLGDIIEYGVARLDYQDNKLASLTRIVTIKQAEVDLLRQYTVAIDSAAYVDKTNGKTYNTYAAIGTYTTKSINFKGESVSGYYEEESYRGYNNIACVIKGVEEAVSGKTYKFFDLIYIDPKFYPATESGGVYTVANNATPINIVASSGTYVVELSFDTEAYINYKETKFYVVYRVVGVPATIYIDATNTTNPDSDTQKYLPRTIAYDTQDHIEAYKDFGRVEGLVDLDKNKGAGLTYKVYRLNNDYAGSNFVTVSGTKYELVTSMINAGTYIVVVAHDTIPVAGYELSYRYGPSELTTPTGIDGTTDNSLPYFTVTVSKVNITISVEAASKFYSQEFAYSAIKGNIKYTVTDGEIFASDITNVIIGFTSTGFAANAPVGKYDVVANCTGSAAQNYNFVITETQSFTVNKAPLQVTLNRNITKEYGTEYNLQALTRSDLTITKYSLLEGDTLSTFKFLSAGASATANVGVYRFVGTYEVATEYVYGKTYYLRASATSDTYVYTVATIADPAQGFEPGKTYYVYNDAIVTGNNIENYYIEIVGTITVTPKTITVDSVSNAASLEYDAEEKNVSVTFSGVNGYSEAVVTSETFNNTIHYTYTYAVYEPVSYTVAYDSTKTYYVYNLSARSFVEATSIPNADGKFTNNDITYYLKSERYDEVTTTFNSANTYYTYDGEHYNAVVTVSTDADIAGKYTHTEEHYDVYNPGYAPATGVAYYTRSGEAPDYTYTQANVQGGFAANTVYYTKSISYVANTAAYDANTVYYTRTGTEEPYTYDLAIIDPFGGVTYYLARSDYEITTDTVADSTKTYYTYDGENYNPVTNLDAFEENVDYFEYGTIYVANTDPYNPDASYFAQSGTGTELDPYTYAPTAVDPFGGNTYYVVDTITYNVVTKAVESGTYYTYDGNTYTLAAGLEAFVMGTTYYTHTEESWDEATTYQDGVVYYTRTGFDPNYEYTPYNIIAFEDNTTYYTKSYVYTALTSTVNFVANTDYYVNDGTKYIKSEGLEAFVQGTNYFTYTPGHFDLATAYDANRTYYVVGADEIGAVVVYNGDADIKPIDAGDYTVTVSSISGAKAGNYTFASETKDAWDFTITKREVTVTIESFTMGYGDTKLTPVSGDGYIATSGSFIAEDITSGRLELVFKTDDMTREPQVEAFAKAVYLELDGEAKDNYILHYATDPEVNSYGSLTVTSKALAQLELKEENIKYNKGNDLTSVVEVDSSHPEDFEMVKFEKKGEGDTWSVVDKVTVVGAYRATVKLTDEAIASGKYDTTGFDEAMKTIEFNVVKATWLIEDFKEEDFAIYYNKLVFNGNFEGAVKISLDGVFDETTTNTITGLKPMTTYVIKIKVAESANYKESAVMQLRVKTSYDPTAINLQLTELGDKFGFKQIATYVSIRQNYELVSDGDKSLVDSTKFNAAKARYELLINSGNKAIKVTKTIVGKTMNKTYTAEAVGVISGVGLILAGLSCFTIKKRGQKRKTMRKLNKKTLLTILVLLVTLASFTMLFVGCKNKEEETPETPVDDGKLTDTTFLTAAGSIENATVIIELNSVEEELQVYSEKLEVTVDKNNNVSIKSVKKSSHTYLDIDEGSFDSVASSFLFNRTDMFSSTKIKDYTFTGVVSDPAQYLGITEDGVTISDATVTINLINNKDNTLTLKSVVVVYKMVVDTIEYEATITVTPGK